MIVAVTTRSRLRGLRFFPVMLVATIRVRRQLARTEGVVRWASVLAGPREFWTVTVWRSRHEMQEFMRSGAHGEIMWVFARWLSSFWLARWRPGLREVGSWDGLALAGDAPPDGAAPPPVEIAFLRDAMDAQGRITFDASPLARRSRERLEGAGGLVVRLAPPLWRLPAAALVLARLRRDLRRDERLLGAAIGAARGRVLYLFAVWRDADRAGRVLEGPTVRAAAERFGDALWAHQLVPENEFGHWDGARLRRPRATRGAAGAPRSAGSRPSRARAPRP